MTSRNTAEIYTASAHVVDGDTVVVHGCQFSRVRRCKDCAHYEDDHCLTWCKKFRHRTNANGYCAWPDDSAVR